METQSIFYITNYWNTNLSCAFIKGNRSTGIILVCMPTHTFSVKNIFKLPCTQFKGDKLTLGAKVCKHFKTISINIIFNKPIIIVMVETNSYITKNLTLVGLIKWFIYLIVYVNYKFLKWILTKYLIQINVTIAKFFKPMVWT